MTNLIEDLFQYKLMLYLSIVIPIIMAIIMLFIRKKSVLKPLSIKRILLPTVLMATGLLMFLFPYFRISSNLIMEAIVIGLFFSVFLIYMSEFEIRYNKIYLIPSKSLFFFFLLFFLVRMLIKLVIGSTINVGETAGTFFILAFSSLFTWRIAMAIKYIKLKKKYK